MSEHLDYMNLDTHGSCLVAPLRLDSMPQVLAQCVPVGLVPDPAQEEGARPVARVVRAHQGHILNMKDRLAQPR